jgi:hypothetical protein
MNIPDHISESLETFIRVKLKILKFFDADPGSGNLLTLESGMGKILIRDNIPDPQHCYKSQPQSDVVVFLISGT